MFFNILASMSKTRNSLQRSSESMKKTRAKNGVCASVTYCDILGFPW
jgi:hypothetical protein